GNAGGLGNRSQRFEAMIRAGLGVNALAYRGSTGSGGTPSEEALRADAKLLAQLTAAQYPGVEIAYYGESLGTGVAAWLATEIAPARMVLEAPYTSIPDAALQTKAPGWVRVLFANLWDTEGHIAFVTAPLLVLHGIEDQVIPVEQGRAVYEAAGSADKRILTLPGVGHHDVWQPEVQAEFLKFLKG
ncbi:MAG: alpha-beta hydrolase superfamily lysophospholipase, partial [Dinoroseobacter sp.]